MPEAVLIWTQLDFETRFSPKTLRRVLSSSSPVKFHNFGEILQ